MVRGLPPVRRTEPAKRMESDVMRIHCDACGRELESEKALQRTWDGTVYSFCSERCARAGRHLADDVSAGADDVAPGPEAAGDQDEPSPPRRSRSK